VLEVHPKAYPVLNAAATLLGYRRAEALRPTPMSQVAQTLSPEEMAHLEEMFRRGIVRVLMQSGGWRRMASLDEPRPQFLWQRHSAADFGLRLSGNSFLILRWLVGRREEKLALDRAQLTLGDQLVLALACDVLRARGEKPPTKTELRGTALPALLHPDWLAAANRIPAKLDFAPWTSGTGALVIEALCDRLAAAAAQAHRTAGQTATEAGMERLAEGVTRVTNTFVDALEAAARWDLATPILEGTTDVVDATTPAQWWLRGLPRSLPLTARQRVANHAAELLVPLERLDAVRRRLGVVRYFEDDYEDAQHLLSQWRPYEDVFARATGLRHSLESWGAITAAPDTESP